MPKNQASPNERKAARVAAQSPQPLEEGVGPGFDTIRMVFATMPDAWQHMDEVIRTTDKGIAATDIYVAYRTEVQDVITRFLGQSLDSNFPTKMAETIAFCADTFAYTDDEFDTVIKRLRQRQSNAS